MAQQETEQESGEENVVRREIVEQRMRILDPGKEEEGAQHGPQHRDRQQAACGGEHLAQQLGDPAPSLGGEQCMEREDDQRIGEQIDDEPQVLPRRHDDALERAEAEIIGAPERCEGLRISVVVHQIDPHLGRNDDDHREDGRDQQACAARPQEGERFAAGKQGRGGISRHQEQQRQPPAVQRQHG